MTGNETLFQTITWWGDSALDCHHDPVGQVGRSTQNGLIETVIEVERPRPLARIKSRDWDYLRTLTVTGLAHVFAIAAFMVTPMTDAYPMDHLQRRPHAYVSVQLTPAKKPKPLSIPKATRDPRAEGRVGTEPRKRPDAAASKSGAPRVDGRKRDHDRAVALSSGLLPGLREAGGAVATVLGPGGIGTGINHAIGGLTGTRLGNAGGAGGLGVRGVGPGGGPGSIGIGVLRTRGGGNGGTVDIPTKKRTIKNPFRVPPDVRGSLTHAEIRRVIRRNLPRFRFCYERHLNQNPNLAGKVSPSFTIAPDGTVPVASLRDDTVNDSRVGRCVLGVVKSLKFPKPRGGGIVVVTYPFVFESI